MIAKITKGRDYAGIVRYVMQEEKKAELIDFKGVLISDKQSIISSFSLQCQLNPKVSVVVGHISLDFSAEDSERITNDLMVQIAQKYMERMNIKNTQYILARHYDREHPHCHLIFNRVNNNGKTISDRNDRLRSTKICLELTEEYGLYIAAGKEHVKRERLKEPDSTKYLIYDVLIKSIPQCKNWDELKTILSKKNINVLFICRGSTAGIQGVVFEMNGFRFNGSKIDRKFSYSKMSDILLQNEKQVGGEKRKKRSLYTRTHISPIAYITSAPISTNIVSRVCKSMVEPISTTNVAASGSCGEGSQSSDLEDDEYIDEYGIRRKRKYGIHR